MLLGLTVFRFITFNIFNVVVDKKLKLYKKNFMPKVCFIFVCDFLKSLVKPEDFKVGAESSFLLNNLLIHRSVILTVSLH